jgi:hypothetical protein
MCACAPPNVGPPALIFGVGAASTSNAPACAIVRIVCMSPTQSAVLTARGPNRFTPSRKVVGRANVLNTSSARTPSFSVVPSRNSISTRPGPRSRNRSPGAHSSRLSGRGISMIGSWARSVHRRVFSWAASRSDGRSTNAWSTNAAASETIIATSTTASSATTPSAYRAPRLTTRPPSGA